MFPDLTRDDVFRLETRRLWLRWPRLADVQAIVRLAGEKAVAEMTARIPHPYTIREMRSGSSSWPGNPTRTATGCNWPSRRRAGPTASIGAVGIGPSPDGGKPHLGYWLGTPSLGAGLCHGGGAGADRCVLRLWRRRASSRPRRRVINPASRRVLEKCGFAYQGSGLVELPARGGLYPAEHFRLDRRAWESLKTWGA